jgi:hypothetical protein
VNPCDDASRCKICGSVCESRRTRSRGGNPSRAANARRALVPNSACNCSLKIGTCTSLASQERAIAPRPSCSMRFNMPLAAPCLCTKSTTATQNASLVDCPHSEGKCAGRFITIVQHQNEFECSQRNPCVRKMNTSSLALHPARLVALIRGTAVPRFRRRALRKVYELPRSTPRRPAKSGPRGPAQELRFP